MRRESAQHWYWIITGLVISIAVALYLGVLGNRIHDLTKDAEGVPLTLGMIILAITSLLSVAFGKWLSRVEESMADQDPVVYDALVRQDTTFRIYREDTVMREAASNREREQLVDEYGRISEHFAALAVEHGEVEHSNVTLKQAVRISMVFEQMASENMAELAGRTARMAFESMKVAAAAEKLSGTEHGQLGRAFVAGSLGQDVPKDGMGILLYQIGHLYKALMDVGIRLHFLSELPKATLDQNPHLVNMPPKELASAAMNSISGIRFIEQAAESVMREMPEEPAGQPPGVAP